MKAAAPQTQAQIARAYMTPHTSAGVPDEALRARIGTRTVAGGFNNSIIFRAMREGKQLQLVPDSKLAADLMQTPAGPRLVRILEGAARTATAAGAKSELQGFILPRDTQAVAATDLLAELAVVDQRGRVHTKQLPENPAQLKWLMGKLNNSAREGVKFADAWTTAGWVTLLPESAREVLTAAGAYRPDPKSPVESYMRRVNQIDDYVAVVPTHEVQHTITPNKGRFGKVRWMEEGIASLLSEAPLPVATTMRDQGLNPRAIAGQLAHAPKLDLGWGPWKRPEAGKAETAARSKQKQQRYVDSQPILTQLLLLSGVNIDTPDGVASARQLLQGDPLYRVPGKLAKAIIERNKLDPSGYERLRQRIMTSIEDPNSVGKIAADFEISPTTYM